MIPKGQNNITRICAFRTWQCRPPDRRAITKAPQQDLLSLKKNFADCVTTTISLIDFLSTHNTSRRLECLKQIYDSLFFDVRCIIYSSPYIVHSSKDTAWTPSGTSVLSINSTLPWREIHCEAIFRSGAHIFRIDGSQCFQVGKIWMKPQQQPERDLDGKLVVVTAPRFSGTLE